MHTGSTQHLCGNTGFAPGRVVDALALAVLRGGLYERALERGNVLAPVVRGKTSLDALPLLNEVQALQGVGVAQTVLDIGELARQGLAARATPATGPAAFESFEIATNGKALSTAGGKCRLVLDSHNGALPGWSHENTMAEIHAACNSFYEDPRYRSDD